MVSAFADLRPSFSDATRGRSSWLSGFLGHFSYCLIYLAFVAAFHAPLSWNYNWGPTFDGFTGLFMFGLVVFHALWTGEKRFAITFFAQSCVRSRWRWRCLFLVLLAAQPWLGYLYMGRRFLPEAICGLDVRASLPCDTFI